MLSWWLSLSSVSFSSRLLCFRRSNRLVNASSRLVWLDDVGVAGFWLLFVCRGGVAATAARVGSKMFSGNSGCCLMVLVVSMCVSGVLRRYRVKNCGSGSSLSNSGKRATNSRRLRRRFQSPSVASLLMGLSLILTQAPKNWSMSLIASRVVVRLFWEVGIGMIWMLFLHQVSSVLRLADK